MRRQAEAKIAAQTKEKSSTDKLVGFEQKNDYSEEQVANNMKKLLKPTRGKYGNIHCSSDGVKFDSKKERKRFLELKAMQDAGEITELHLQQHFTLIEPFTWANGKQVRRTEYVADFTYFDKEGCYVIEDVKSPATRRNPVYSMKKRMMAQQGYFITEV